MPTITRGKSFGQSTDVLMSREQEMKKTHEFSIIASGLDPNAENFESRFFDAGCDDATISFQKGHIIVDFARKAHSLEDAIATAVEDVNKAGAKIDRVEPDSLVSLSDMASRAGVTRAAMSNYYLGNRAEGFPPPVARVTSKTPLWDWSTVARWMFKHQKLSREEAVAAEIVRHANAAIDHGDTQIRDELKKHAEEYAAKLEAA
jgi:hypothetical protein